MLCIFIAFILTITLPSRNYYYQPQFLLTGGRTEAERVANERQKWVVNLVILGSKIHGRNLDITLPHWKETSHSKSSVTQIDES